MKLKSLIAMAVAAAFAMPLAAQAHGNKASASGGATSSRAPTFSALDTDNDGKISRDEWNDYMSKHAAATTRSDTGSASSGVTTRAEKPVGRHPGTGAIPAK